MTIEPFLLAPLGTGTGAKEEIKARPPSCGKDTDRLAVAEKQCSQAIHSFCMQCQGRLALAVKNCEDASCSLYLCRMGSFIRPEERGSSNNLCPLRPLRAARVFCLDCCSGERGEVRKCKATTCKLWPFRLGVSPLFRKKLEKMWWEPRQLALPF